MGGQALHDQEPDVGVRVFEVRCEGREGVWALGADLQRCLFGPYPGGQQGLRLRLWTAKHPVAALVGVLILLGVALVVFLFCQKQEIEVGSIFLQYANNFLKDKPVLFALIPVFMLCSFGLVVLCAWQYIAIGSANAPTWTPPQIYKHIQNNIFLLVLNVI